MNLLANPLLTRTFFKQGKHIHSRLFNPVLQQQKFKFSYLQHQAMRFQQVDAIKDQHQQDSLKLSIPFAAQNLDINFKSSESLSNISDSIKKLNSSVKSVDFFTIDGAIIPQCEPVQYRDNIPFVMTIQTSDRQEKYSYAVNLNSSFSIVNEFSETNIKGEEAYLSYCVGIGLPKYTSFLLANFASKFHHTLPKTDKVSNEDILKGLYQTIAYYRALGSTRSILKGSDIEKILNAKQQELIALKKVKTILDKKADFRAKSLLALGSFIFVGQFAFIMSGTFVYYSWDVMEPISYMMLLGNFTVGFLFYVICKRDMGLTNLRDMLGSRFARSLYRKRKLDIERLQNLEKEINDLRQILNKSLF